MDRTDYQLCTVDCFLTIWQASKDDEFIIISNGFGIFEEINDIGILGKFQFTYHLFYVISPKLTLVLYHALFREEIGVNIMQKRFRFNHSIFEYVPYKKESYIE